MSENNEVVVEKQGEQEQKKERKKGGGIGCLITLLIILLTPVLVVAGMYFLSRDFKFFANKVMSQLPGSMGDYFASQPTRADELHIVKEAADFLMTIDDSRIIDKLKLIKVDDGRFYDDLIKEMLRLNPNRTRQLLESMRDTGEQLTMLDKIKSDIEQEKEEEIKNYAEYLASLTIEEAAAEIERVCREYGGHARAARYFDIMDERTASRILYLLNNDNRNQILALLSTTKANKLRAERSKDQKRLTEIEQLAVVLRRETGGNIASELERMNDEDKVALLRLLGPRVAGLGLANFASQDQVYTLIARVKNAEIAEKGRDEVTPDILKALKVYRDYADKVGELTEVYLKMDSARVIQITRDMMINSGPETVYRLDNGDSIEISDMDLVTDILSKFSEKKLAEILSGLDDTLTSELTRRMVLP